MYKWRVLITPWDSQTVINKYFHSKNEAFQYFKENEDSCLAIQLLKYNGIRWYTIKWG